MSLALIQKLNAMLLAEMPEYRRQAAGVGEMEAAQRNLLRALMNVRPPRPLTEEFVRLQDELLAAEREERGAINVTALSAAPSDERITLWQGDITRLSADALMERQGHPEETGTAKITQGYNLPARHVIHTVGPIVSGVLTDEHRELLASCYRSCLHLAAEHGLRSIVFCCISTGEFHFPNKEAAEIAVREVRAFLAQNKSMGRVVCNGFKDEDRMIYERLLS